MGPQDQINLAQVAGPLGMLCIEMGLPEKAIEICKTLAEGFAMNASSIFYPDGESPLIGEDVTEATYFVNPQHGGALALTTGKEHDITGRRFSHCGAMIHSINTANNPHLRRNDNYTGIIKRIADMFHNATGSFCRIRVIPAPGTQKVSFNEMYKAAQEKLRGLPREL